MITPFTSWTLVLGLGILPLAAQPSDTPNTPLVSPSGPLKGHLAERLKLTEDQKTQIQTVLTRHGETIKTRAQAAAEARKAFREAERNPEAMNDQLKTLYQAKSDQDFGLMLEHRSQQNEIRALLTPEQRTEWDKLRAYHQGAMHRRRGKA